jgi:roadblock/LC7 domain-containing protein
LRKATVATKVLVLLAELASPAVRPDATLVLLAGQVLQTSATNAARLILTGQAQNANDTLAQFKSGICASLTVMFNCANNLYIDAAKRRWVSMSGLASW